MHRIKFYSETDMACSWEINKIIGRINEKSIDKEWNINDVIEFYNILKYLSIEDFRNYINDKVNFNDVEYVRKIKCKIGKYLDNKKDNIIKEFDVLNFGEVRDFFELIDKYGIYKCISNKQFEDFLSKEKVQLRTILKFKKIVKHFDNNLKNKIMSNPLNAEIVISKYIDNNNLYLPNSLTEQDVLTLISEYISVDSENININVLRSIIHFPNYLGIRITDKIKLKAVRREKEEVEKIFSRSAGIESSVSITYVKGLDEPIKIKTQGGARKISFEISRDWIEENTDYPTLWNNYIYLFGIVDSNFRLTLVSKKNAGGIFEDIFSQSGDYLYRDTIMFQNVEMMANAQIYSYINVLNTFNISIKSMIEWFFSDYLRYEFSINDFIVKLPLESSSHFEKCRTILPEIDRIFKQYNLLIEDGNIDQDLVQISSSSLKINEVKSFISKKYVYSNSEWYYTASYLLFSDQSGIFYIPGKEEKYNNFMELIVGENVFKNDFEEFQLQRMEWLFEHNLIIENEDGFIKVVDLEIIFILKELYYEDVLNYFRYGVKLRRKIDSLEGRQIVRFESSLFTKNEQDYFDFYMNKSKFTNGYDIRNKYLHGTNSNDETQYERDYYSIIKLIIIIVLKINDDLCLNDLYNNT